MTDPKDRAPSSNAPSWVDDVLTPPAPPREGGRHQTSGNWEHWPQTDAARDLRLPEDPPRPAPPAFDSDDWAAKMTGGQVRVTPPPASRPAPSAPPRTDAWGDAVRPSSSADVSQKKIVAAVLAILLGGLGVHKFYLGRVGAGFIVLGVQLALWVLAFILSLVTLFLLGGLLFPLAGTVSTAFGIIGVIEGVIYLTKSDADFEREYIRGKKAWF